jgi:hypothetical protein
MPPHLGLRSRFPSRSLRTPLPGAVSVGPPRGRAGRRRGRGRHHAAPLRPPLMPRGRARPRRARQCGTRSQGSFGRTPASPGGTRCSLARGRGTSSGVRARCVPHPRTARVRERDSAGARGRYSPSRTALNVPLPEAGTPDRLPSRAGSVGGPRPSQARGSTPRTRSLTRRACAPVDATARSQTDPGRGRAGRAVRHGEEHEEEEAWNSICAPPCATSPPA